MLVAFTNYICDQSKQLLLNNVWKQTAHKRISLKFSSLLYILTASKRRQGQLAVKFIMHAGPVGAYGQQGAEAVAVATKAAGVCMCARPTIRSLRGIGYFSIATETSKVVTEPSLCTCTHFRLHLHLVKSFLSASPGPSLLQSNQLSHQLIL